MKEQSVDECIVEFEGRRFDLAKLNPKLASVINERGIHSPKFLFNFGYGDHTDDGEKKPYKERYGDHQQHSDHRDRHKDRGTGHQDESGKGDDYYHVDAYRNHRDEHTDEGKL